MLGEWDAARDYVMAAQRVVDGRLLRRSSEDATTLRVPLLRALAILEVSLDFCGNQLWNLGCCPEVLNQHHRIHRLSPHDMMNACAYVQAELGRRDEALRLQREAAKLLDGVKSSARDTDVLYGTRMLAIPLEAFRKNWRGWVLKH
jgi:hypothetical protein